jgi:orotate phosphoribosyltransferase
VHAARRAEIRQLQAEVRAHQPLFFQRRIVQYRAAIAAVGRAYAATLAASDLSFDMLFGPAYKGIPLVTVTAAALAQTQNRSLDFAFNRKEAKDHGEGGNIVGSPLRRVLIVDDVITAGTAIRESIEIIKSAGATPAGVLIALDRQERGAEGSLSAVQEVRREFGIPVIAVIGLAELMRYMQEAGKEAELAGMRAYRELYGV